MIFVIGSGPAGVACASALLDRGAEVTMLDAGLELEPERRRQLALLQSQTHTAWRPESLRFLRDGVEVTRGGIPLKRAYGSAFPYRDPLENPIVLDGAYVKPSFARGGLSNVWGASVMPYRTDDMTGWPITADDLAPHYRAVLAMMPFAGRHDGLEDEFPLYHARPGLLPSSAQAADLLRDLELNASALAANGVRFGASRLAVQAEAADGKPGCVRCGNCLYGCPYELIYNSAHTLERIRTKSNFTYRSGIVVEQLTESDSTVEVRGRNLDSGESVRLRADRVFLACGVLSTARIMLTSLEAFERPVYAVDNCYFLLPLLRSRGSRGGHQEPLHTLAQVFLELRDPAVGSQCTHLQIYTYNDLFDEEVKKVLGPLYRLVPASAKANLLCRLLLIQGYLHSDLSARIRIVLSRGAQGQASTLNLAAESNPRTRPALAAVRRRLWGMRGAMRSWPLSPRIRPALPGRGFHTGGTFPMRRNPAAFEADVQGRPHGLSRVHIVDASVFPSLPATTITLSVMANAHRIGSAAIA